MHQPWNWLIGKAVGGVLALVAIAIAIGAALGKIMARSVNEHLCKRIGPRRACGTGQRSTQYEYIAMHNYTPLGSDNGNKIVVSDRQQQRSVLEYLTSAYHAALRDQPAPSLLPISSQV